MANYKTEQRKKITEYLINNQDKFLDAKEILEYMNNNNLNVGLTTIYRFLNMLEKNNDVRVEIKNHTKHYQYVSQKELQHLFLKCKKCGKSMNLNCKEFEIVNKHIIEEHKFNLDYNTIIYGTCNSCYKK